MTTISIGPPSASRHYNDYFNYCPPISIGYNDSSNVTYCPSSNVTYCPPISVAEPEQFLTRKQLKDYCSGKEINKDVFESIDERVPFGTDTLDQLNKAGITSKFIKKLNRERKLKRILSQN